MQKKRSQIVELIVITAVLTFLTVFISGRISEVNQKPKYYTGIELSVPPLEEEEMEEEIGDQHTFFGGPMRAIENYPIDDPYAPQAPDPNFNENRREVPAP
ncbi:hypothetical protein [Paenibacillus silvisoli]|uniref:hypothetical protein n=1 Tax=Paenibacillus silvisoli TaxID=3110539 RepID=UPI0028041EB5|nr:hypothetical protein [Paenibacillus silvisoli]